MAFNASYGCQARSNQRSAAATALSAQPSLISHRPDTAGHALALGRPDVLRSIVASLVVCGARRWVTKKVKGTLWGRSGFLAKETSRSTSIVHVSIPESLTTLTNEGRIRPVVQSHLRRSNDVSRSMRSFTLYNIIAWQLTLAESGSTPNVEVALVSNPESRADGQSPAENSSCLPGSPLGLSLQQQRLEWTI